jgi:hypothetical protein
MADLPISTPVLATDPDESFVAPLAWITSQQRVSEHQDAATAKSFKRKQ